MAATAAIARAIHVLLLALWTGAGAFYLVAVIPEVTHTVPGPEARGLLSSMLSMLDLYGFIAGPILLLTLLLGWTTVGARIRVRAVAGLLMTVGAILSGRWITPRAIELEKGLGKPLEQVAADDPIRISIEQLLVASDATITAVVVLGVLMLVASGGNPSKKRPSGIMM